MSILVVLLCVSALIEGSSAIKQLDSSSLNEKLQKIIDGHAEFWNASFSFAIHNDTLEAAVASGLNDYAAGTKLTPNISIPMGSTTKMFSAVSVLRLVDAGKLQLEQPVAPLVDKYLAVQRPCDKEPAMCLPECVPIAHCLSTPTGANCSSVTPEQAASCSYCLPFLHCHCNATTMCPATVTLKMLWGGQELINTVTFGQLIGMQSGVMDYYFDRSNWLMNEVLLTNRTIEPVEYLMHMNKSFLFAPTSGRASYSTNGFSLVGLALAGLLNYSDWSDLDQKALAWGSQRFADDQTLFPGRGPCMKDARIAHQYASNGTGQMFFDLDSHSCLNSWLGGNIAARPLDVARFTYRVFSKPSDEAKTPRLLSASALKNMTQLHEVTDGFAAHGLSYGLGLEAMMKNGEPAAMDTCGMASWGHAGEDYGSGSPLSAYIPALKVGVSLGVTSANLFMPRPMGMNCSLNYNSLPRGPGMVLSDLVNAVASEAGLETPPCPVPSYTPPPASECEDAPSFGKLDYFIPVTCEKFLATEAAKHNLGSTCDDFLSRVTLWQLQQVLANLPQHIKWSPPSGYDVNKTMAVDLCKGTCGAAGAGPCWMRGAIGGNWCHGTSTTKNDEKRLVSQEETFVV